MSALGEALARRRVRSSRAATPRRAAKILGGRGVAATAACALFVLTGRSRLAALVTAHRDDCWSTAHLHEFRTAIGEDQAQELMQDSNLAASSRVWDSIDLPTSLPRWRGLRVATGVVAGAAYVPHCRDDS